MIPDRLTNREREALLLMKAGYNHEDELIEALGTPVNHILERLNELEMVRIDEERYYLTERGEHYSDAWV
jgi:predicted transcriptional regulator